MIKKDTNKRGRKPAPEESRKSRVIQTRVPQDLESTLKNAAEKKRMTVSHLIRHVLEDTFNLVDGIVSDSSILMENITRDAKKLASTARGNYPDNTTTSAALLEEVDAWQDVILNKPGNCIQCNSTLRRGEQAFRGLSTADVQQTVWLCKECIETL